MESQSKKKEPASPESGKQALRLRLAHLLTTIFSFTTLMGVSFLHFGQKRGKLIITVSSYTRVRVLLLQIGHGIHKEDNSFCSMTFTSEEIALRLRLALYGTHR